MTEELSDIIKKYKNNYISSRELITKVKLVLENNSKSPIYMTSPHKISLKFPNKAPK